MRPDISGIEGLSLNITVPKDAADGDLPVLVYIHGGGFVFGSSYFPHYDQKRLVKQSIEEGRPIIAINIK